MSHHLFDPYEHRLSPIHRLPAIAKVVGAVVFVFVVAVLPRRAWSVYAVCGGVLILIAVLSRISALRATRRLLLLEPFVIGIAALSLLQTSGASIFLSMVTKSTLCVLCMVLLSSTTRFSDILRVLWRLHVPPLLVTSLALMYRYLSLLVDETIRMARARKSRTFIRRRGTAWGSSATVIAHLFARTSERAERIYAAMCARGWKT